MSKDSRLFFSAIGVVAVALIVFLFFRKPPMTLPETSPPEPSGAEEFCTGYLSQCVNKRVKVRGKVSNEISQHIIGRFDTHPATAYFDIPDNEQTVVYTTTPITAPAGSAIEVIGKVVPVGSGAMKPGEKIETPYVEYHILAESWQKVE